MKTVKLLGNRIGDEERGSFSEPFADIAYDVRRGHETCGDSAFAYCDDKKAVIAVFDGVSGEPGAAEASSIAALAILNHLKGKDSPTKNDMQESLVNAHANVIVGYTTASVAVVERGGRFICASVGDSTIYSLGKDGGMKLELQPMRTVGKGAPVDEFIFQRMVVPVALGLDADMQILMREGKLDDGDFLLVMTDAIMDNLKIKVKGGKVADTSGVEDLRLIIGDASGAANVVKSIRDETVRRMDARFDIREKDSVLVSKLDDLAIVGLLFKKA
jgi:hypothetical protein